MTTKIIEYAKNKKMYGGGNSEVSGTINIEANGLYGVAKYATANVNVPDTSGMAIEVSELPTPTADTVGKVYKVGEDYYVGEESKVYFNVGDRFGSTIYFDTSVDLKKFATENLTTIFALTDGSTELALQLMKLDLALVMGSSGYGSMYMLMTNYNEAVYIDCDVLTFEQFNEIFGQMDDFPHCTKFGWQMDEYDVSHWLGGRISVVYQPIFVYKEETCFFKSLDNPPILQEKTVTENGVVTPDAGYDGLSKVTVDVASSGGGEDTATLNALIDGSITEIESGAERITNSAFRDRTALETVNFPNATSIGNYAFYNCQALSSVNIPNTISIGSNAFESCKVLTSANFQNATSIGGNAFRGCSKLASVNIPNTTSIEKYMFYNCFALTTVNLPNVTRIEERAFFSCSELTSTDFPNVTSIGSNAFESCKALTSANFQNATSIGGNAFRGCFKLATANFSKAESIEDYAFNLCYRLNKVIIGTDLTTIATLSGSSVFYSCYHITGVTNSTYNPTGAKDGYIYVPLALVANYRVATNWTTYASQIMPYVATVEELANIDGTTYDKACVGTDYTEYTYNGTAWEVYER